MQLDAVEKLLMSDVLSADEYLAHSRSTRMTPEHRLMWEVLRDAIDVLGNGATGKDRVAQRERDLRWVQDDNETWIFSFRNVCEALGMDPDAVRRAIGN